MYLSRLSESKGSTYKQCKLKYRYKYVDKLPEGKSGDGAMEFGSFIHKVLEEGYQATDISQLFELADKHKASYSFSPDYNPKIEKCLSNFLKFNAKLSNTLFTELAFEVEIMDGVIFNGVIDRGVGGTKGGILIIDYKTGKREKSKSELFQDNQLKGYAYAVSKLYKKPYSEIIVAHYYPVTNTFVDAHYNTSQINSWLRATERTLWSIRKTKKEECMPCRNQFCNNCAYKDLCPEFNNPIDIKKRLDELANKSDIHIDLGENQLPKS